MTVKCARSNPAYALVLAILASAILSSPAFAQSTRRGASGGGRGATRQGPTQPTEKPMPATPGNLTGRILKFKPAADDTENDSISGYLLVKPFEKGAKLLKLNVFKPGTEEAEAGGLVIRVADHQFDVENCSELFWKGLYCTAGWGFKDDTAKNPKVKELRVLTFDTLDVEGKVDKVEDDTITLRVVPRNGNNWPHLAALEKSKPVSQTGTEKKIRSLKVKLKLVEDVTRITDAEGEETSLSSFEAGQAIHAKIVYSQKVGMLIKLSPPNAADIQPEQPKQPEQPRGRQPEGGGRPQPRGPRGGG